jgi:hypothetical protein
MDYAVSHNCDIIILGDIFDLITHGDKKRYTPEMNKYGTDTAINSMLDEAIELFTPYAKNIKIMLCGNHEASGVKYHNLDITTLLIWELNKLDGVDIKYLGYQGYIRFKYFYPKGKAVKCFDVKAHHGTGGSAEITKGTITLNRFMLAHDADLHVMGHTHTKVILPCESRSYLNHSGKITHKTIMGFITGAYVHPVIETDTKLGGKARPYSVDYGDTRRTLQSTGGIMISQTITKGRDIEIDTKIIC